MARLLDGDPIRSDGKLTVKSLAAEAGLKRWHPHTQTHRPARRVLRQGPSPRHHTRRHDHPPRRDRSAQRGPQTGPGRTARRRRSKGDPRPRDAGSRTRERATQRTGERTRSCVAEPAPSSAAQRACAVRPISSGPAPPDAAQDSLSEGSIPDGAQDGEVNGGSHNEPQRCFGPRSTGGGSVVWDIRDLGPPHRRGPRPQRDRQPRRSEAEGERMPPPPR